jgi:hypothetical protein
VLSAKELPISAYQFSFNPLPLHRLGFDITLITFRTQLCSPLRHYGAITYFRLYHTASPFRPTSTLDTAPYTTLSPLPHGVTWVFVNPLGLLHIHLPPVVLPPLSRRHPKQ